MNIVVIDDHLLFAQSLQYMLQRLYPGSIVEVYTSADAFLEKGSKGHMPDILITDLMMPNATDGMDLLQKAKLLAGNKTKFILLTSVTAIDVLKRALHKGASAYLTKDISEDELREALDCINAGDEPYIQKSMRKRLLTQMLLTEESRPEFRLSKKEREVLNCICSGKVPKEISAEMSLSINTINQYIKTIKQKFRVNRTTEIALFAIEHGLYEKK